jgi:hypothetical protein
MTRTRDVPPRAACDQQDHALECKLEDCSRFAPDLVAND